MPNAYKAGWLVAPCRIMDPSKQGAKAVFKVVKLDRDENYTTLHGMYVMSGERGSLRFANHIYLREV